MSFNNYRIRKTWLDKCLTSRVSEDPSTDNVANGWKHCCNLNDTIFTMRRSLCSKKSLLVIYKIRRLFLNTLTADDKDYLLNKDNLTQQIRMKVSQKQNTFSRLFFEFLKSILNFEHWPEKDDPHSWWISRNTASKKYA